MSLAKGTQLGPYEVVEHIGAGGMGDVYKARDTRLDRFVAIKTSRAKYTERFEREMRTIASLSHPNVCTLHDVGPNYLVMELLEGQSLQQLLAARRLSQDEAVRIAAQIADALEAAHAKGITHRDIKPGNIFVSPKGHVKVLDFGLAKLAAGPASPDSETQTIGSHLSMPGQAMGTVAYMSPEQARGQDLDARTDLWALGVILFEMLSGARPFDGPTHAVIYEAIFYQRPALPADVPTEIAAIVTRLLEKSREQRYQTAAEVLDDLRRIGPMSSLQTGFVPAGSGSPGMGSAVGPASPDPPATAWSPESSTPSASARSDGAASTPSPNPSSGSGNLLLPVPIQATVVLPPSVPVPQGPPPPVPPVYRPVSMARPSRKRSSFRRRAIFAAIILFLLWQGLSLFRRPATQGGPSGSPVPGVVVAELVNRTDEAVWSETLREALTNRLQQSGLVLPMSPSATTRWLDDLKITPGSPITPELALDLCRRSGRSAVIGGSITKIGDEYALELTASGCRTFQLLASASGEANSNERVLAKLSDTADELARKLSAALIPGGAAKSGPPSSGAPPNLFGPNVIGDEKGRGGRGPFSKRPPPSDKGPDFPEDKDRRGPGPAPVE